MPKNTPVLPTSIAIPEINIIPEGENTMNSSQGIDKNIPLVMSIYIYLNRK